MNFKTILACAALLIGIGTATAAVESDIVGYQTVTLKQQWNLMAVQFGELGSTSDSVDINAAFADVTGIPDGAQLQVPDGGSSYDIAVWNGAKAAWCVRGAEDTVSTLKVTRGRGVWLRIPNCTDANPATVTFSGTVTFNREADTFEKGYTIVCPPAPLAGESINHSSMTWDGLVDGDQLQVPDGGSSYDIAVWNTAKGKWCIRGAENEESPLTFPEGAACWLKTTATSPSLTFSLK